MKKLVGNQCGQPKCENVTQFRMEISTTIATIVTDC